jgi:hypothetical protein
MKKDEKLIKKVLQSYMMTQNAEICNKLYTIFKKLCYDIHVIKKHPGINIESLNSVGTKYLQNKMSLNLRRFKNIKNEENFEHINANNQINIAEEFSTFLKTCGCDASEEEISTMLHFVEKMDKHTNSIGLLDLFDIWGTVMNFSKLDPFLVFKYVLEYFIKYEFQGYDQISSFYSKDMNKKHVEKFLDLTNSYFQKNENLKEHIRNEVKKFDQVFSPESLTLALVGPLKYFPK